VSFRSRHPQERALLNNPPAVRVTMPMLQSGPAGRLDLLEQLADLAFALKEGNYDAEEK
jgi:hypothetical protein